MAKIKKVIENGGIQYPATITDAVKNPNNGKTVTEELSELGQEVDLLVDTESPTFSLFKSSAIISSSTHTIVESLTYETWRIYKYQANGTLDNGFYKLNISKVIGANVSALCFFDSADNYLGGIDLPSDVWRGIVPKGTDYILIACLDSASYSFDIVKSGDFFDWKLQNTEFDFINKKFNSVEERLNNCEEDIHSVDAVCLKDKEELVFSLYMSDSIVKENFEISSLSGWDIYKADIINSKDWCVYATDNSLGSGILLLSFWDSKGANIGTNVHPTGEPIRTVVPVPKDASFVLCTVARNRFNFSCVLFNNSAPIQRIEENIDGLIKAESPTFSLFKSSAIISSSTHTIVESSTYEAWRIYKYQANGTLDNFSYKLELSAAPGANVSALCFFDSADNYLGGIDLPSDVWSGIVPVGTEYVLIACVNYATYKFETAKLGENLDLILQNVVPKSLNERLNNCEGNISSINDKVNALSINPITISQNKSIRILFFGNSVCEDAVSYLPWVLKTLSPELDFTIYDWYCGGVTQQRQWDERLKDDIPCERLSVAHNTDVWTVYNNSKRMTEICAEFPFDILVAQEYFNYTTPDGNNYDVEYFNKNVAYIASLAQNPAFKVATLLHAPNRWDLESYFTKCLNGNKTILRETMAQSLIAPGLAVYNACKDSEMSGLGDDGYLSNDGTHAQEGLPCLMQAYVIALWIWEQLGIQKSVAASGLVATQEICERITTGPNWGTGAVVGTDAQNEKAKLYAIKVHMQSKKIEIDSFDL